MSEDHSARRGVPVPTVADFPEVAFLPQFGGLLLRHLGQYQGPRKYQR